MYGAEINVRPKIHGNDTLTLLQRRLCAPSEKAFGLGESWLVLRGQRRVKCLMLNDLTPHQGTRVPCHDALMQYMGLDYRIPELIFDLKKKREKKWGKLKYRQNS